MEKKDSTIASLILKYAAGIRLTAHQSTRLAKWRAKSIAHNELPEKFKDWGWVFKELGERQKIPSEKMWKNILKELKFPKKGRNQ